MSRTPYILTLCSHKGGTGRTTAAAALTWCFGQSGLDVTLIDADAVRSASFLACDAEGRCHWPRVRVCHSFEEATNDNRSELWIVDCPSLLEPAAGPVLERSSSVILTALADPLSIWTVQAGAEPIQQARRKNANLELLGMLIGIYDNQDMLQFAMLAQLRERHGELILAPPIPVCSAIRDWAAAPGSGLPPGPASEAFVRVTQSLLGWVRAAVRV